MEIVEVPRIDEGKEASPLHLIFPTRGLQKGLQALAQVSPLPLNST